MTADRQPVEEVVVMRQPPRWAGELVAEVVTGEAPGGRAPELVWRQGSTRYSSGHYGRRPRPRIVVTAGLDPDDARHVLVHELAHWLADRGRRRGAAHSVAYWRVAWALHLRYAPDLIEHALEREANAKAGQVAAELGLIDAAALAQRARGREVDAGLPHLVVLVDGKEVVA